MCVRDRVNLMVPPGARLTTLIYACMKLGAVIVVADTGLGIPGLTRALKGANPSSLVGIPAALSAARTLLWPGVRISVEPLGSVQEKLLGVAGSVFTAPAAEGTPGAPVSTRPWWSSPPLYRMLMRRCCTPPVRPARLRVWCTRSVSWQVCVMPLRIRTVLRQVAAWWLASRRLRCWAWRWVLPA